MVSGISKEAALALLKSEAEKIKQLISNQQNHLCIAQCKAFEEVVDTQMYGFSKQVDFAVKLEVLSSKEGQALLAHLEQALNKVYNDVYEKQQEESSVK